MEQGGEEGAPVEVDVPVVLGRQRAHRLEETELGVGALLGGGVDVGRARVRGLRQVGEPAGEHAQTRSRSHGCRCSGKELRGCCGRVVMVGVGDVAGWEKAG